MITYNFINFFLSKKYDWMLRFVSMKLLLVSVVICPQFVKKIYKFFNIRIKKVYVMVHGRCRQ